MVIRLFEYQLPLKDGQMRKGLVLQNEDRFGEIAPLPGFSSETFEKAKEETIQCLRHQTEPILPSVRFGFSSLKKPLQSVHIPLSSLGPKNGFSTWKLKLGHLSLKQAIEYTKNCLGKASLRLDFNRKWSLEDAIRFTGYFKRDDFEYLEEPVPTDSIVEFSKKTHFPIALDESIHLKWEEIPSLKAIVVKPTIVGFIPDVPTHLKRVLSSSYESDLGLLHIANLANENIAAGLDTYHAFKEVLLVGPLKTETGLFSRNYNSPILDFSKLCRVL